MTQPKYISLKEASEITGKSVQTIRRMIKGKKIKYRKERTPQGFNYLIESSSLGDYFVSELPNETPETSSKTIETPASELTQATSTSESLPQPMAMVDTERAHQSISNYDAVKEFTDTIQQIVSQHGREKENLFKLIESFQNKVIALENKLKAETVSKKGWFKLW